MKTEHQNLLLAIARNAILSKIRHRLGEGGQTFQTLEAKVPKVGKIPDELKEHRASFVTLTLDGNLRGCIGMLEACRPLAEDVAANACAAAFGDPRFQPLRPEEFEPLEIHISVLSPPEEMTFSSEADLLSQIQAGVDGLILQEGSQRGTFLPCVWEDLPDEQLFLMHLKMKAGLSNTYWSDSLRVFRYSTEYFPD